MGPDGRARYRIAAERIVQNPDNQSIGLTNMRLTYRATQDRDWTLTARNGYVPPGSKIIDLAGDVEIVGLPVQSAVPAVVRTERLQLDTQNNLATSAARVDILWGNAAHQHDGPQGRFEGREAAARIVRARPFRALTRACPTS